MNYIALRHKKCNLDQLTREKWYTISVMLKQGYKQKEIAEAIGKDKSVVSREIKRNKGKRGYTLSLAQMLADERKERFNRKRTFTKEDGEIYSYET